MHSKRMKRNKSSLKMNCPNESILQVDLNEIKKISRNEVDGIKSLIKNRTTVGLSCIGATTMSRNILRS